MKHLAKIQLRYIKSDTSFVIICGLPILVSDLFPTFAA